MERRAYPRVAVNLTAAIVNGRELPIGSRVCNISSTGILLRHPRGNRSASLRYSDNLEVRISLKDDKKRKVIRVPMTIVREGANDLAARFLRPQPQLMRLIEPYRVKTSEGDDGTQPGPDRDTSKDKDVPAMNDDNPTRSTYRIPAAIAVTTFGFAICILLFSLIQTHRLKAQIDNLSSKVAQSNAENRIQPETRRLSQRMDAIQQRLNAVLATNTALKSRLKRLEDAPDNPPASSTPAAVPSQSDAPRGAWIINLVTLYNHTAAEHFAARARAQGIKAVIRPETIHGRPVWRVQVGGYATYGAAEALGAEARTKLRLRSVWIHKQVTASSGG